MLAALLFALQFTFWAIVTAVFFNWTAQAWIKRQHRLFGLTLTAALCTSAMLLKFILI